GGESEGGESGCEVADALGVFSPRDRHLAGPRAQRVAVGESSCGELKQVAKGLRPHLSAARSSNIDCSVATTCAWKASTPPTAVARIGGPMRCRILTGHGSASGQMPPTPSPSQAGPLFKPRNVLSSPDATTGMIGMSCA